MAQDTMQEIQGLLNQLNESERERVIEYAEELAGETTTKSNSRESLDPNRGGPSYTAAADPDVYDRKKQRREKEAKKNLRSEDTL